MKTATAYEVFQFLKVYIFEDLLILNALYQKYIANTTNRKYKYDGVLHFGFTILFKKGEK